MGKDDYHGSLNQKFFVASAADGLTALKRVEALITSSCICLDLQIFHRLRFRKNSDSE
jgi:hypothetical protein